MSSKSLILILIALLCGSLTFGGAARAETEAFSLSFTVNSTLDEPDANPGNTICASTPSGTCTLRAAIMEANRFSGPHTINLQPNSVYLLTRSGLDADANAGDLDILKDMTINGADSIVDGNGAVLHDRVFNILNGAKVTLSHLTIRHGESAFGGGIDSSGTLTLTHSIVISNTATGNAGGIGNGGTLTLINTTVKGNTAGLSGGGLYNNSQLTILNSTIDHNKATSLHGGGLYNDNNGTMALTNSTLSTNSAGNFGGGLFNKPGTTTLMSSSTIAYNLADSDDDNIGQGGGVYNNGGSVKSKNTIIAYNRQPSNILPVYDDCSGTLTTQGHNLIQHPSGCTFANDFADAGITDLKGFDPKLGPLQNNGGPTFTHALASDSVAIDSGPPTACRDENNEALKVDQRIYERTVDGNDTGTVYCDIGAYEYGAAPAPSPFVNPSIYIPLIIR